MKRPQNDMMAHSGGKDTQQQLLQRHHHQQHAQQQHQQRVDDLPHVCAPGARNQTSYSIMATLQDLPNHDLKLGIINITVEEQQRFRIG